MMVRRFSGGGLFVGGLLLLGCLALALLVAQTGHAAGAGYGPVAAYSFDEGTGTTAQDATGNEHTATIEGAKWARGRYGDGLEFKGSEHDVVKVPASSELNFEEEFTLEAWIRPASSTDKLAPIVGKTTGGGSGSASLSYYLYAGNSESKPSGEVQHVLGTGKKATATTAPPGATWTHLALTYDGAVERLYVNGVQVAETATEAPVTTTGELQIGAETEHGEWFSGRIDEVRIYDRVLSGAEVDAGMETPIQTPKQDPVAAYSFDEGTGSTVADVTGDGHTATIEGAKWVRGRYGDGLEFKGSEHNVVKVPASSELNFEEEFTLEAWIRPASSTDKLAPIVGKTTGGGSGSSSLSYYLYAGNSESKPYGEVQHSLGTGKRATATSAPPGATWTHVALTYDGAVERLYVNGAQVAETATEAPVTTTGELQIGAESEHGEWFSGRIDEVRIYNRALNGAEVGSDMEAPLITPKQGPVAAYSFDEGEPGVTTVADVTGDGHTGTIEEGEWTNHGRYGGAINFEGGTKCVSVADSPELRFSEEFTLEAWVRPEGTIAEDPVVVRESSGKDAFGLGLGSREEGEAEGFIGEGSGSKAAVGGEEIREYEWVHLAATWDGSKIRLYVDGELADTETATGPPASGEGSLKIGCDGPDGQFTGRVDEVRAYNRTLDGAEVDADMESPIQTPKATPVAAYSFDEKNEEIATDTTGDGHTATVEGAKWSEHGRYGGALEFDAAEKDVLKIPASSELDLGEEFTLEAWVRPSGVENKDAPLIDKQEGEGLGYALYEGGTVSDRPEGAAAAEQEHVHADECLPAHAWSHVALTFDGNRTWLYVDGKPVDNGGAVPTITSEGELEIGGSTDTADYFDGRIDEVRIYNRALDGAEVAADMEAPVQTPKQGPIAAWSFEEGEGTTTEDVTGDEHEGTIEGAKWARGKYGEALKFDGEGDVVKVPDSLEFDLTEGFTLESWVRPESTSNEWAPILAKEMGGGKATEELAWWLYEGGEKSSVPFGGNGPTAGKEEEAIAEDPLPVNVWSHLALTYDGFQVRLYVDGELVDCSDVPAGAPPVTEGELQIGAATDRGDHFVGRIDEVRIYNRALSAGEVADDLGPLGMTATYISEEEGEEVQAEATTFYPQTGAGASATYGPATVMTSVTRFGALITGEEESGASPFALSGKHEKPYQFAKCEYSHNEPGVIGVGTKSGPSRGVLKEIAQEAAASVQKAAKTSKPHGFPNCDGNYDAQYFHFQWGDEIWGDFFYERNKKVWIEEAPQCEAWAPEAVELEWAEYRQKVREGRNPHRPIRQDAKPKEEHCFSPQWESTKVPGGIDVISYMSWTPAYLFKGVGSKLEKACGDLDGHLTANPPSFEENGLREVWKKRHLYGFYVDKNTPCDWADPGGTVRQY
jgi:Concanavalin A-like lectin/glucanases superfamily